jgi:hypothetical protein
MPIKKTSKPIEQKIVKTSIQKKLENQKKLRYAERMFKDYKNKLLIQQVYDF